MLDRYVQLAFGVKTAIVDVARADGIPDIVDQHDLGVDVDWDVDYATAAIGIGGLEKE